MSVTSIDRSFRILQAVAVQPGSLSELARVMNIPTSTMGRFLGSLQTAGAVQKAADGTYSIGPTIARLAGSASSNPDLVALAGTHIPALAKLSGETAGIAAAADDDLLHLTQVSSDADADVQVRDWTGEQVPAHSGCTGFVMMAYWSESHLNRYLAEPLEAFSEHTVVDPCKIQTRLEQIRLCGYLWTTDEYAEGVTSVAAPVRDHTGRAVGALHVFGPSYRFPLVDERQPLAEELCRRAAQMTSVLSFQAYKVNEEK